MLTELFVRAVRPLPLRWRLFNTFVPQAGERSAEIYGCRFRLDLSEEHQRAIYLGGYDARTQRALAACLPPGGSLVDARAGAGLLVALAARQLGPAGRILAAEPHTMSYLRLEGMVRDSHLNQVILRHGTLADGLDEIAQDHGMARIDLLRLGPADLALLVGAARLLGQKRIANIACDLGDSTDRRVLEQVSVLGFQRWRRLGNLHFFRARTESL
jgi:hypothetical protein